MSCVSLVFQNTPHKVLFITLEALPKIVVVRIWILKIYFFQTLVFAIFWMSSYRATYRSYHNTNILAKKFGHPLVADVSTKHPLILLTSFTQTSISCQCKFQLLLKSPLETHQPFHTWVWLAEVLPKFSTYALVYSLTFSFQRLNRSMCWTLLCKL